MEHFNKVDYKAAIISFHTNARSSSSCGMVVEEAIVEIAVIGGAMVETAVVVVKYRKYIAVVVVIVEVVVVGIRGSRTSSSRTSSKKNYSSTSKSTRLTMYSDTSKNCFTFWKLCVCVGGGVI